MPDYKTCTRCGEPKPLDAFNIDGSDSVAGRKGRCRACEREVKRERYGSTPHRDVYTALRADGRYGAVAPRTAASWRRQDRYRQMSDRSLLDEIAAGSTDRDLFVELRRRSTRPTQ